MGMSFRAKSRNLWHHPVLTLQHFNESPGQAWACANYRDHAKIFLVTQSQSVKTAAHEMCGSDHDCFHRVGVASIRRATAAFSGEGEPAI
jgi:hypothetical protein